MAANKALTQLILDYCEATYMRAGGFFDSFAARPIKKTEIVHRCEMAGFRVEAICAQLADLCKEGWLLDYSSNEDDIQFFPGWTWVAYRAEINSPIVQI